MRRLSWASAMIAGTSLLLAASAAQASSAIEYPDNGVAQFSRGGAWLATATDPIAGYYNPAALGRQPTQVGLGANFVFQKICFKRLGAGGKPTGPSSSLSDTYPEVCNSNSGKPNVVPNLAVAWRVTDKLGLGLTVTPPSSFGKLDWPATTPVPRQVAGQTIQAPIPAAQRYLSMGVNGTILLPTLAAGYDINDKLSVGAGFVAGIAILQLKSMSMANVSAGQTGDEFAGDALSTLDVKDMFVPGFVVSGLYSPTPNIDVAAWYRWSDSIRAKGDLSVLFPYYDSATGKPSSRATTTKAKDAASVTMAVPMEARIGARWHMPRRGVTTLEREGFRKDAYPTRDPLRDDLYDVELDLTWANNSAQDNIQIRFPPGIQVTSGAASFGEVPQNSDRPTGYHDTFGARLGGQYNVLVNRMGIRLGTWIESSANDAKYLTVTGVPSLRGGFGGGLVFRVGMVDLEAGYQHLWSTGFDNHGDGAITAVAASSGASNFNYRSPYAVNGGSVTQHADIASIGAVARF